MTRWRCGECGDRVRAICDECQVCKKCCECGQDDEFDADELGLDPETDMEDR